MAGIEEQGKGNSDYHPGEELNKVGDDNDGKRGGEKRKKGKKKLMQKDPNAAQKRGVCYLSRIPPQMDPSNVRHILSQYGDIQRIYLVREDPTAKTQHKRTRGKKFSEGWVEFTKKSIAKKVANMLNGETMGGKKKSPFYHDTWNIKYLSKFKWDDLTNEIADKNRTREQKLAMEISAAKRERDFYMSKVEQSRALNHVRERLKKKRMADEMEPSGSPILEPKVIRQFPQNRPISDNAAQNKPRLSKDILSAVFGQGS